MHAVVQDENNVRLPISAGGVVLDRASDSTVERFDRRRYDVLDDNAVEHTEKWLLKETRTILLSMP
jgi:hypothetical protein